MVECVASEALKGLANVLVREPGLDLLQAGGVVGFHGLTESAEEG